MIMIMIMKSRGAGRKAERGCDGAAKPTAAARTPVLTGWYLWSVQDLHKL